MQLFQDMYKFPHKNDLYTTFLYQKQKKEIPSQVNGTSNANKKRRFSRDARWHENIHGWLAKLAISIERFSLWCDTFAWMPSSMKCSGQEPRSRAIRASRTSFEMQSNDSRSRADLPARAPLSNLSRFSKIIGARCGAARQSDDPRARTPTDLNCKLISLLCSQPPSAYHLSPIRDAVVRHVSHRSQL